VLSTERIARLAGAWLRCGISIPLMSLVGHTEKNSP
jgi:hypothetical protein